MVLMPMVGDELAGYRLRGVLGRGGMSVVFEAENPRLGSTVGLKVLAPELAADDVFRARFLKESRIAASLSHPNVIPIYDMGSADGLLYISMRHVVGADLHAVLRAHQHLTPAQALPLIEQAARALDAAHRHGLVHRDVKPGNLLVERGADDDDPDHVYLTDFGITKHSTSHSGLTHTGEFMGTIDYIAPEQIQGKAVDGRTDVYSLGCVLYECVTGRVPFVKDIDAAVIWAHVQELPAPPSTVRSELPADIDAVIRRALAKEPDDRYQTCRELAHAARDAFQNALASSAGGPTTVLSAARGEPGPARPRTESAPRPSPPYGSSPPPPASEPPTGGPPPPDEPAGAQKQPRHPRRLAVLGTLGIIVLILGAAVGAWAIRGGSSSAHASGAMSSSMSPTPSHSSAMAQPSSLSRALIKVNELGDTKGTLPPKSCQQHGAATVTCTDPNGAIDTVTFHTFPTLGALYAAYVKDVRFLGNKSGNSIRRNYGECNTKSVEGEVGWNHNSVHPKIYSLAQSQSGTLDPDRQLSGRVFCKYTSEYQLIWTDNPNRILGVMSGAPHDSAWQWWHKIHHAISIAGSSMHM
jgi:serine/threonine protein kinase